MSNTFIIDNNDIKYLTQHQIKQIVSDNEVIITDDIKQYEDFFDSIDKSYDTISQIVTNKTNKICLIALCYNEIKILPFAVNYWRRLCDHVIIYDNGSTDGSVEYLKEHHSDLVEIRQFKYSVDNKINDQELTDFKNNCWKDLRGEYDWVIICDIDELLYVKYVKSFLSYIFDNNISLIKPVGYQLISTQFPVYQPDSLLHNQVKYGVRDNKYDKCVMFNINKVEEINYEYGCHLCHPVIKNGAVYQFNDIYLFHAKWLTWQYVWSKNQYLKEKLSEFNISNQLGIEYMNDESVIQQQYFSLVNQCEFIDDWYDKIRYPLIDDSILDKIDKVENKNGSPLVIFIPIYKDSLDLNETESLNQLIDVISNRYNIVLCCDKTVDLSFYKQYISDSLFVVQLPHEYFKSIETYNQLCLSWKFYELFSNYEYMLIYQLDSIIYYDNLDFYMNLNYSFIGALHDAPYRMCGNGGFSLRKIKDMIDILKNTDIDYTIYEDIFINSKIFNKTPNYICRNFAVSWPKTDQYSNIIACPMGEHYVNYHE